MNILLRSRLVLGVALGYVLLGQLGRWIAVPPGFSSPLWPAAGWALVAVLRWGPWALPGVGLGHAGVNALISLSIADDTADIGSMIEFSLLMGLGGAMQALVGSWGVRRAGLWPGPLNRLPAIFLFLLISGPLACSLSSSWGVALLVNKGAILSDDMPWNWLTWWVGDTLGVLCAAPIFLVLLMKDGPHWKGRWSMVSFPMLIVILGSIGVFLAASRTEEARLRSHVEDRCQEISQRFHESMILCQSHLEGLRGLFLSSQEVSEKEFEAFTRSSLADHSYMRAYEWLPRIAKNGRDTFPVTYINPIRGNEKALGFDLASDSMRRTMLEQALRTQKPTLSSPLRLIQDSTQQSSSMLCALPIMRHSTPDVLEGFVLLLIDMGSLVKSNLQTHVQDNYILSMKTGGKELVSDFKEPSGPMGPFCQSLAIHKRINSMGQEFTVALIPKPSHMVMERSWQPWYIMAGGSFLASLFGAILLRISGQGLLTEQLIEDRTRELVMARAQAERASKAKMDFLANMSHEVRTPMNAILGMADVLAETPLNQEQRRYVDVFRRAGEDLLELINEILDLSKAESGRMELSPAPFQIQECISAVMDLLRQRALKKGLAFSHVVDPSLGPWVMGDDLRLRQILLNLLGNAIKFTQRGSVTLRASPDADPSMIRFSVQDTGEGFDPRESQKLFTRFTQLESHSSKQYGGSGLGLAICGHLVGLMQGRIWAESARQLGSSFHFTAKLERCDPPIPTNTLVETQATGRPLDRSLKILVAEDNEDNRLLISALLHPFKVELVFAENGLAALESLQRGSFDLVFMDIQMPELDGLSATRRIRDEEIKSGKPRTCIVALTAHAIEENVRESIEAGCDGHLTKPASRQGLIEAIHRYAGVRLEPVNEMAMRTEEKVVTDVVEVDPGIATLIPSFLKNRQAEIPVLGAHLEAGRFLDIASIAHNLKGLGAGYGFRQLSTWGVRLEEAAKSSDASGCREALKGLETYLGGVSWRTINSPKSS